ncbi:hypothetical protein MKZ38_002274 [Zalerion maritima]|uniref:C2H2-type domain-containing protein n=1 Tax=Zalerion maritima TaxID=339359 RepID=A0AAD5RP31_9PEZI|nr:hypothetical protein MKZ38_002274 [Zalerion maritima]
MSQSTIMHRHWEVPREEDQPKCTKCHISFQTVNELAFHFQQSDAHPGCGGGLRSPETTFVCSTCCGRRFDDLEALQKHRWERKKVGEDERASRFAEKTGKRDWRRAWEDGQGARGFVRQSREQEEESEGEGGLGSAGFGGYEIGEGKGKYAGVYDYYDCEEDDAKRIGRTREPAQTVITKQDLDAVADIMKRMGLE